jgi:hypothetical protein
MTFEATLETRGGGGHVVVLPFETRELFGQVRAPVRVTIRGHSFRTTTMRYGGVDYIGLNREVREAAGVVAGDAVAVAVELDTEPREVELPEDLARALGHDPAARAVIDGLSYTHRKEYARWVTEAKREETRKRRVANAVVMLREGVRTPG